MVIARFCELVAAQIHTRIVGGDNQSTTTVCFNTNNSTLYVATQGDKLMLQHLLQPAEPKGTHRELLGQGLNQGSSGGYKKLKVQDLKQPTDASVPNVWQVVHEVSQSLGFFAPLNANNIAAVKWVTRFDLIGDSVFTGTGFHGESYIIRYLALKNLHGVQGMPAAPDVQALEAKKGTGALVERLQTHFKDVYDGKLYMGSSQGACSRCAKFMGLLGINYETKQDRKGDRADTWVHPFTMSTKDAGYRKSIDRQLWLAPKLGAWQEAKKMKNAMDI